MGFSCSWIAVRTDDKATLLDYLGMVETGELVAPGCEQSWMSVHQAGNGWTILFCEDFGWADAGQIQKLSRFGTAVGVQFEDKVAMEATIYVAEKGKRVWRVSHNAEHNEPLNVRGTPPAEFAAVRRKFEQKQAADDGVNWLFEIPLELARTISGYRVDESAIDFVALDSIAASNAANAHRRKARPKDAPTGFWGELKLPCSVIAIRTTSKKQVFDYLRRIETDRPVWPRNGQSALSFYETDTGWIVLASGNIYWASDRRLRGLSTLGLAMRTSVGLGFSSPGGLSCALNGKILFGVPPALEDSQKQLLPADVRAALDEDWNKFDEDEGNGRSNYAMERAIRLLWGLNIGKPKYPFITLKRRWPWTLRSTLLE